jgi:hypothetical protein
MANPHPSVRGRTPGVPNKFHSERAVAVEREGKRLPPANLLIIAENSMAMAARYQPGPKDNLNPEYNEDRYAFWLDRAREALRDVPNARRASCFAFSVTGWPLACATIAPQATRQ